ncbi:MAG: hypothetical protein KAX20_02425 [Candidatus Omnitrophica bacterium]|nr:hypothetical protein [Candidatus Omnitrophota bacterium]
MENEFLWKENEWNTYSKLRTTADKREIFDFLKLPSATSFIRKPLSEMAVFKKSGD